MDKIDKTARVAKLIFLSIYIDVLAILCVQHAICIIFKDVNIRDIFTELTEVINWNQFENEI